MININRQPNIQLSEADNQFIELIQNRITSYGRIPYNIDKRLVVDVIKECARAFYKYSWRATQKSFWALTKEDIEQSNEIAGQLHEISYIVTLNPRIRNVMKAYETNVDIDNDITPQALIDTVQLLQRSAPYGQSIIGINNNMYIMEATCRMVEKTVFNSVYRVSVPTNYNILTKKLYIHRALENDLVLECISDVDIQILYNDEQFFRYTNSKCQAEMKRVVGGHEIELPSGTINVETLFPDAEEWKEIETALKAGSGIGDVLLTNS